MDRIRLLVAGGLCLSVVGCGRIGAQWDGPVSTSGTTTIEFMVTYTESSGDVSDPPASFQVSTGDDGSDAATALTDAYNDPTGTQMCSATLSGDTVYFSCPGPIQELKVRQDAPMGIAGPWTTLSSSSTSLACGLQVKQVNY